MPGGKDKLAQFGFSKKHILHMNKKLKGGFGKYLRRATEKEELEMDFEHLDWLSNLSKRKKIEYLKNMRAETKRKIKEILEAYG